MRVAIFGSCVSRDLLEVPQADFLTLDAYYARSSVASAFSESPFVGVDTSTIASAFQRRMVDADVNKTFPRYLDIADFDGLLIDLIDERFDLLERPDGQLATRSNEFLSATVSDPGTVERVPSGMEEFRSRWELGWARFVDQLGSLSRLDQVIVHEAYWAESMVSGAPFPKHPLQHIRANNAHLAWMYDRIRQDVAADRFVRVDAFGADEHKWGPAPFHYESGYYSRVIESIRSLV